MAAAVPRSESVHPGATVAGKYRVTAVLGRGRGMLLDAEHTDLQRRVVLRLVPEALSDGREVKRFRREVHTISRLESEHIARVLDVGSDEHGSFFLVREHLDGPSLASHVADRGALSLDEAVLLTLQLCEAVQEAHSHDVVLRELDPRHMFLVDRSGQRRVKIADFGTAKILKRDRAELIATVMAQMSPYASPELMRDPAQIDLRTDVWSLGCIFYELLAGHPPFLGESTQLMLAIARGEARPLSHLRPELPAEIDAIIGWALAKDPEQRFQSVYGFAYMLRSFASRRGQLLIDQIGRMAHGGEYTPPSAPSAPIADVLPTPAAQGETTLIVHGPIFVPPTPSSIPHVPAPAALRQIAALPNIAAPPAAPVTPHIAAPPPAPAPPLSTPRVPDPFLDSAPGLSVPSMAMSIAPPPRRHMTFAAVAALTLVPLFALLFTLALNRDSSGVPAHSAAFAELSYRMASAVPAADDATEPNEQDSDVAEPETPEDVALATKSPAVKQPATRPRAWAGRPKLSSSAKRARRSNSKKAESKNKKDSADKSKKALASKKSGTLAAVALGRKCTFTIDGVSRGMRAKVTARVSAGKHTVSCRAADGTTRSRRVTVTPGRAAVAAFRF